MPHQFSPLILLLESVGTSSYQSHLKWGQMVRSKARNKVGKKKKKKEKSNGKNDSFSRLPPSASPHKIKLPQTPMFKYN